MPVPACTTTSAPSPPSYTATAVTGPGGQCTSKVGTQLTTQPDAVVVAYVDLTMHPGANPSPTNANGFSAVVGFGTTKTGTGASTVYHWGPGTFNGQPPNSGPGGPGNALVRGHTYRFMAFAHNSAGWSAVTNVFNVTPSTTPTMDQTVGPNNVIHGVPPIVGGHQYFHGDEDIYSAFAMTDDGGVASSAGVVWSPNDGADASVQLTYQQPADRTVSGILQTGVGQYSYHFPPGSLQAGRKYKIRAWGRNVNTVNPVAVYGPVITFQTPAAPPPNTAPTVILATTPQAIGPHTMHADGIVSNVGIAGGDGQPGTILDAGFVWTEDPAVAADMNAFKIGTAGVSRVVCGPQSAANGYVFGADFDVTPVVHNNSDVEGGARVWVRAYATNGQTDYAPDFPTAAIHTPINVSGRVPLGLRAARAAIPDDHTVLMQGYCEVYFEGEHPFEDPVVNLFEQDADPTCHLPNTAAVWLTALGQIEIPRLMAGAVPIIPQAGHDVAIAAGMSPALRASVLGTSELGKAPLARGSRARTGPDVWVVRHDSVDQPGGPDGPPPPPVVMRPRTPKHFKAQILSPIVVGGNTYERVRLTWDANIETDLAGYTLQLAVRDNNGNYDFGFDGTIQLGKVTHYQFDNLDQATAYGFRLAANNTDARQSPFTAVLAVNTPDETIIIDENGPFDLDGIVDETDHFGNWLSDPGNVPHGPGPGSLTHVLVERTDGKQPKLRIEGGLNAACQPHGLVNVLLDFGGSTAAKGTDGTRIFNTIKTVYVVRVTPGHDPNDPSDSWDVVYRGSTPSQVKRTFTGGSGGTAESRAAGLAANLNRIRSIFRLQNCTNVDVLGAHLVGTYDGTGYNSAVEGQDGFDIEGSVGCGVDSCTVDHMWGNGLEASLLGDAPNYTATKRLWVRDSSFHDFGRQTLTLSAGGVFIFERCFFDDSARSLIDSEPNNAFTDPEFAAPVDGVYIIDNQIGHSGGVFYGIHPGVRRVLIARNRGVELGCGLIFGENIVIRDNVETGGPTSGYAFSFERATANDDQRPGNPGNHLNRDFGGQNIYVTDNLLGVTVGCVEFRTFNDKVCSNYRVVANDDRSGALLRTQFVDDATPPWSGTFNGGGWLDHGTLPIPSHPLRDLTL